MLKVELLVKRTRRKAQTESREKIKDMQICRIIVVVGSDVEGMTVYSLTCYY